MSTAEDAEKDGEIDFEALQAEIDRSYASAKALVESWFTTPAGGPQSASSAQDEPLQARPPRLGLGSIATDFTKTALIDDKLQKQLLQSAQRRQMEAQIAKKEVQSKRDFSDVDDEDEDSKSSLIKRRTSRQKDVFKSKRSLLPTFAAKEEFTNTPPASISSTATSLASPPPIASTSSAIIPSTANSALQESLQDEYMHSSYDEASEEDTPFAAQGSPGRPKVPYAPLYDNWSDDEAEVQQESPDASHDNTHSKRPPMHNPILSEPVTAGASQSLQRKGKRKRKRKTGSTQVTRS